MTDARSFWTPILTHAEVEPHVLMGLAGVDEFLWWLGQTGVREYRYEDGGFVTVDKGDETEIHVAFLPSQWGRPLAMAFRDFFSRMMDAGHTLVAREQEGHWRSRPPASYGWRQDGVFEKSILPVRLRRWVLTRDDWLRSAVGRKIA